MNKGRISEPHNRRCAMCLQNRLLWSRDAVSRYIKYLSYTFQCTMTDKMRQRNVFPGGKWCKFSRILPQKTLMSYLQIIRKISFYRCAGKSLL